MKILNSILIVSILFFATLVFAQEEGLVDYGEDIILDSDLDGLTDLGEQQLFLTDPQDPDTDGDGMLDGAEILGATDPNDPSSPVYTQVITKTQSIQKQETPWPWYTVRASGLIAFVLLYLSIVFGLAIRLPGLSALTKPVLALDLHKWFSLQALLFALVHAVGLLFDKFMAFSLADVFIPFAGNFHPVLVALGTIGFYLMIVLVATSYARNRIPFKAWRFIHYFNIVTYLVVAVHMVLLGTDMKTIVARMVFVAMNIAILFLVSANVAQRIRVKRRMRENQNSRANQ